MMLVSRIFLSGLLKCKHRFQISYSRCFASKSSNISSSSTIKSDEKNDNLNLNEQKQAINNNTNNEWLWAYLRDRKNFADLSEEQRRDVIQIEMQTLKESGERVPEVIPDERWTELLNLPLLESRKKLYGYLFLRELSHKRRAATVALNDIRRAESAKRRAELLSEGKQPTNYPGYSSIFRHIGRHHEKSIREQILLAPARLGELLVIDCGFEEEHARGYYLSNLVDQIQYLFADITRYHSPSFVYLCNLSRYGRLRAEFTRRASLENMCFEFTESNYLDLFPHDKLIYLSPDSNVEMTSFDHDAIYIIGGIADRTGKKPLTFGKAKRENIKHQRFPIDRYVKFGGGSGKSLTIDQVYNILMTLKHTGSWVEAFKYIPDRKIVERYSEKMDNKPYVREKYVRRTSSNS
ncbi:unnamed protein product [Rotaria sp. Silwood1]|nr:unnamed protein product [Rotaria sp. Silwood1]CAF0850920.1 unnamed protein product [Rotaria sp. Silwood1]CAF0961914.1 unnamed protein product [Rotaria sp. Silwood1]CAF3380417.1 unnamed protein product [Rotaria sp. Silwood1]CAF3404509.1 unnamed protein product [Rotaria sp. Silwood1]